MTEPAGVLVASGGALRGRLRVPGDKSISHRAAMFAAIAHGRSHLTGFLDGADCLATIQALKALGVPISGAGTEWTIEGVGLDGLKEPDNFLDVGNSGTTIRLVMGLLAGAEGTFFLTGDASIRRRPMGRVMRPLAAMGARMWGRHGGDRAPIAIQGTPLAAMEHRLNVPSAQVKSALLLAGLRCHGETVVTEPLVSRDHTERMLAAMGADLRRDGTTVHLKGPARLEARDVQVAGDFSSAAFWLVAASVTPGSDLVLEHVGMNPTRTGLLDVLMAMGARIEVLNPCESAGEPVADLHVQAAELHGVTVDPTIVPRLVDEVPVLALAAAMATGTTVIRGAEELRVKESDRLAAMAQTLGLLGAHVTEHPDGLDIVGPNHWHGGVVDARHDHRVAMTLALLANATGSPVRIRGAEAIATSYPGFWNDLQHLRA